MMREFYRFFRNVFWRINRFPYCLCMYNSSVFVSHSMTSSLSIFTFFHLCLFFSLVSLLPCGFEEEKLAVPPKLSQTILCKELILCIAKLSTLLVFLPVSNKLCWCYTLINIWCYTLCCYTYSSMSIPDLNSSRVSYQIPLRTSNSCFSLTPFQQL